jgi:inorganic pyrophosphatase
MRNLGKEILMSLKKVPFGEIQEFNVVVEIPTGGQKKYEYDPVINAMRLDGVLYDEVKFPFNYGHIPQTISGDGDALDVFIISTHPITPGTVVTCRPVGMLEVIDRGHEDHKIIAVPLHETRLETITDITNIPEIDIEALKTFYGHLPKQWSREIQLKGFFGKDRAVKELLKTQILE